MRLHNFYTGCERIFKLIAKKVDTTLSQDSDWHKRLLNQIALEVPGIRPAVISYEIRKDLEALLYFRHIVNVDSDKLNPKRLEELIKLAVELHPKFASEIGAFTAFLTEVSNHA